MVNMAENKNMMENCRNEYVITVKIAVLIYFSLCLSPSLIYTEERYMFITFIRTSKPVSDVKRRYAPMSFFQLLRHK